MEREAKDLFEVENKIIALDYMEMEEEGKIGEELKKKKESSLEKNDMKNESVDETKKNVFFEKPENLPIIASEIGKLVIAVTDFFGNVFIFANKKIQKAFNILQYRKGFKITQFSLRLYDVPPPLIENKYLFDMGYAYYMKITKNWIAISHDFGICLVKMT